LYSTSEVPCFVKFEPIFDLFHRDLSLSALKPPNQNAPEIVEVIAIHAEKMRGLQVKLGTLDLGRGPLIRGQLLQVAEDEHVLVITMHHVATDEWR